MSNHKFTFRENCDTIGNRAVRKRYKIVQSLTQYILNKRICVRFLMGASIVSENVFIFRSHAWSIK